MIEPTPTEDISDTYDPESVPSPRGTSAVTLNQREKLVEEMRRECKAQLKVIRSARIALSDGSFDPQLTSAANTLAKSVAVLSAEGRQLDKHREQTVINITEAIEDEVVFQFLTEASPARRTRMLAHLQSLDENDSLLGHG